MPSSVTILPSDARPSPLAGRKRGRPANGEIEERKQLILSIATRLFLEGGFSNTTLDAIGKEAGVAKQTIYQHIGDKEALFRAVCTDPLPNTLRIRFDLPQAELTVRSILTSMARQLLEHSLNPETIAVERMMMTESARFPDLVRHTIDTGMAKLNGNIAEVFSTMIDRGLVPPQDQARSADYFYDLVVGNRAFRMMLGHAEQLPDDDEIAERIDIFMRGRF